MTPEEMYRIRYAVEADRPFIRDTWLLSDRNSRRGSEAGPAYIHEHKEVVNRILASPGVKTLVAHVPDNEDAILGWAVMALDRLYYVYVRHTARKFGIAKALVRPLLGREHVTYTHRPVTPVPIPKGWAYNPYRNHHEAKLSSAQRIVSETTPESAGDAFFRTSEPSAEHRAS